MGQTTLQKHPQTLRTLALLRIQTLIRYSRWESRCQSRPHLLRDAQSSRALLNGKTQLASYTGTSHQLLLVDTKVHPMGGHPSSCTKCAVVCRSHAPLRVVTCKRLDVEI